MKSLFLLMAALFYCMLSNAQSSISCCGPTRQFALFASDVQFIRAHAAPLPFVLNDPQGKMIRFKTDDGGTGGGYFIKSSKPTENYLLVFQEYWGLNDYIRQMCDQLQHDLGGDINVLAPDLYDGKVTSNPETAGQYVEEVKDSRVRAIISGALDYAGKGAKIYTIGWCFGGGWSLQASLMAGKQADGCVMYYGLPEKNIKVLKTLHCGVLGIFANKDGWITPKVVDEFAANMKKAGKTLIVHRYDANHAFANPSNPHHNEVDTKNAYAYTLQFLKARIK